MRARLLASALLLLPAEQAARHISPTGTFSIVLPRGWRQATPDEIRALRKRPHASFPPDLLDLRPAATCPYGDVGRWLRDGFDGRDLTVELREGEGEVTVETIEMLRQFAKDASTGGRRYEIERATKTEIGTGHYEAIECLSRKTLAPGAPPMRVLELFVPTGGQTLILNFAARPDGFADATGAFRASIATLTLARHARGSGSLGQNLLYALVVGALVGLLLAVLRKKAGTRARE